MTYLYHIFFDNEFYRGILDYDDILELCYITKKNLNLYINKYNIYRFPFVYFKKNKFNDINNVLNNPIIIFYKLKNFNINLKNDSKNINLFKLYLHNTYNFEELFINNKITIEDINLIINELIKIPGISIDYNVLNTFYFFNKEDAQNFINIIIETSKNYFNIINIEKTLSI